MKGTVVIAGRVYQISDLSFRDGKLQIIASGRGPSRELIDEPAAVFGDDGKGVCQTWKVSVPALGADDTVTVVLPIQIDEIINDPGPSWVIQDNRGR